MRFLVWASELKENMENLPKKFQTFYKLPLRQHQITK
jgi:hypothetical protein